MRDVLASPLLDAALRGAAILLVAIVLTTLLHRRSAALRHAIWAGAIAAQLLLLGLAVWGPRWRVEAPEVMSVLVPASAPDADVSPSRTYSSQPSAAIVTPSASPAPPPAPTPQTEERAVFPSDGRVASSARAPAAIARGPSLTTLLVVLWALGAAALLLRLGAGTVIVARLARRGARVDDGGWLSLAQRLATTLRIDRPLTLLRGDRLGVPVTWGIVYPVVLLPEDADAWPEERRRYVLVHEMAHVKRLDALTQLVGQLALAVFWFNPLLWIAVRRMQLEREHACDDYVLRHGTQPSRYAEDLLEMVRSIGTPEHRAAQPAFAALAMARRTEFEGRMLSILDPVLDRHPLHRGRTLVSAFASLLVIVPLAALQPYRPAATAVAQSPSVDAPVSSSSNSSRTTDDGLKEGEDAPVFHPLQTRDSTRRSAGKRLGTADSSYARVVGPGGVATSSHSASVNGSSSNGTSNATTSGHDDSCDKFRGGSSKQTQFHMHTDDDGKRTIRFLDFNERRCLQADVRGTIVTSDDERRIVALTPPGAARAYFRERADGTDREFTFSTTNGAAASELRTVYRVNGRETAFDDAGRRWFADLLPRVLAEAAINVKPRVSRWRTEGGSDNVLRRIAELRSSGAKRAHYDALLDTQLSAGELDRTVSQAGRDIPSSGDLRAVLSKAAQQTRSRRVSTSTLEEAMRAVPSSGDLTAVLLAFAQTNDREQLLAVARTARRIPSGGDLSRFLIEVAPKYLGGNDTALRAAYFAAADSVPSSGDLSRVLVNAVPYAAKSTEVARAVLAGTATVPSSSDRSRVLVALASTGAIRGNALRDAYLEATSAIPASDDMRRALDALARSGS